MNLTELFSNIQLNSKEQIEILSQALMSGQISETEVLNFASIAKDAQKGHCIEALEFASRLSPGWGTLETMLFCMDTLTHKAPRVKWESAKVVTNLAGKFPEESQKAIPSLLNNAEHEGTVVRWSAANALAAVCLGNSKSQTELASTLEALSEKEEKDSIRKIYHKALGKKK
jgi:HEAT repeat protein